MKPVIILVSLGFLVATAGCGHHEIAATEQQVTQQPATVRYGSVELPPLIGPRSERLELHTTWYVELLGKEAYDYAERARLPSIH